MPPYGSHYRGGEIPGRWQNYAKTLGYYSSAEVNLSIDLSVCFTESRQVGDIVNLLVTARELPLFGCTVTALQGVGRPSEAVRAVAWISTCLGPAPRPEPPPPKVQKVRVTQTSKTHMPGSFSSPQPTPFLSFFSRCLHPLEGFNKIVHRPKVTLWSGKVHSPSQPLSCPSISQSADTDLFQLCRIFLWIIHFREKSWPRPKIPMPTPVH